MIKVGLISIFCYAYMVVLLRILGKKEFSQLNIFDFVLFLIIADIMALAFEQDGKRIVQAVIATAVLTAVDWFASCLTMKSKRLRDIIDGKPSYIIKKGKVDYRLMKKLRYNFDSLQQHLREQSVGSISEVEFAVLEPNGHLSIFKKTQCEVLYPDPVIMDGRIIATTLQEINLNEDWLMKQLKKQRVKHIEEVIYAVVEKDRLFLIKKQEPENGKSTQ